MNYKLRPLRARVHCMAGPEFQAVCVDVLCNSQRAPILPHESMVLDGCNRNTACQAVGVQLSSVELSADNLVAFVLSANLHRQHLSVRPQATKVVSQARRGATRDGRRDYLERAELSPRSRPCWCALDVRMHGVSTQYVPVLDVRQRCSHFAWRLPT